MSQSTPSPSLPDGPLHGTGFLGFLHSPQGAVLKAGFRVREHARGESLALPGGGRDEVFVLESGRVRVHMSDGRRELTLMFLEPGDVFTTHTPAYLTAAAPVRLSAMPTRQFAQHLREGGAPALVTVMQVLGRLLGHTIERLEDLAFRDVHQRLARLLATLVRRQGQRLAQGDWECPLPFSLTDLAGVLGTSRQSLSGAFAELERAGLVQRQGRRLLRVPDLAALAQRAQAETSTG